jgi:hypothetical protein
MHLSIVSIAQPRCRLPILNNPSVFLPESRLLAAMNISDEGRDTRLFLVNVDTLQAEFHSAPDAQWGPYGFVKGSDGHLYVGFFYGRIYRFDLTEKQFRLVADPFAHRERKPLTWGGMASRRGRIYMGVYPTGEFTEYDIASGEAHVVATLPGEPFGVYANQFVELPDGRILGLLYGAHSEIFLYDPSAQRVVLRREMSGTNQASKTRFLCLLDHERVLYSAEHAIKTFNFLRGEWEEDFVSSLPGPLSWPRFHEGRLFAVSSQGEGAFCEVTPDGLREFPTGLHSGNYANSGVHPIGGDVFVGIGDNGLVAKFSLSRGPLATVQLPNETLYGMNICSLRAIPGRNLAVGSHFISSQIFSVDLTSGTTRSSFHKVVSTPGQITCSTHLDGVVYLGAYGGGNILAWNPEEAFAFGKNPRLLCKIGSEQSRPMGLFPDGRFLYTVTRADYGKLGGAISVIDPTDGNCEVYRDFVPTQNPVSFFQWGDLLAGTTEIYGDQGSCAAQAENAVIFVWSTINRTTIRSVVPWPCQTLRALGVSPGGRMIGFGSGKYFVFEIGTGNCVVRDWSGEQPSSGLFLDENRFLTVVPAGHGKNTVTLLDVDTASTTPVAETPPLLRVFERMEDGGILACADGAEIVRLSLHDH